MAPETVGKVLVFTVNDPDSILLQTIAAPTLQFVNLQKKLRTSNEKAFRSTIPAYVVLVSVLELRSTQN